MTAQVYVGTYAKYNAGSIAGAWLDLEKFADKDEFLTACHELHKDEADPELMYQDFEGFPARFYCESGIHEDLFDWLAMDEDDRELLEAYIEATGETDADIDDARDHFQGRFDSDVDFVQELLEACGDLPSDLPHYVVIDWESTARNIMYDYSSANGYYFGNY